MPTTKLKRYVQIKKSPEMAMLEYFQETDSFVKKQVSNALEEVIEQATDDFNKNISNFLRRFEKDIPEISKQVATKGLENFVLQNRHLFKGQKGDSIKGDRGDSIKGDPGYTPVAGVDYPNKKQFLEMLAGIAPKKKDLKEMTEKLVKKYKLEIPTFDEIARGIESQPEKKKLDYYKGLKNQPDPLSKDDVNRIAGGIMRGGGDRVRVHSLSGDGSSKTFTVPTHKRALMVVGTDFPIIYKPTTDFTTSGTTLTLTSEVDAPTNGATLEFLYVE